MTNPDYTCPEVGFFHRQTSEKHYFTLEERDRRERFSAYDFTLPRPPPISKPSAAEMAAIEAEWSRSWERIHASKRVIF